MELGSAEMIRRLAPVLLVVIAVGVLASLAAADATVGETRRGRDYVVRIQLPPVGAPIGLPPVEGPPDARRPLVVIDPGHGGQDPGAGAGPLKEKQLTLQLALALRKELLDGGGIRVAMTRTDDRYLMLAERNGIARRLGADLFVSIHADSAESGDARGASVYTLSDKGTSQAAARIAARENMADKVNGVTLAGTSDAVSAILVDLSQRETQARSTEFARLVLRETRGRMLMHDGSVESAAFAVLKSPDVPSVLFETGYISNPDDVAFLSSDNGREVVASAMARAIRVYFARQAGA
jgi:N-acetylmuramoyl-L-alanine amidase